MTRFLTTQEILLSGEAPGLIRMARFLSATAKGTAPDAETMQWVAAAFGMMVKDAIEGRKLDPSAALELKRKGRRALSMSEAERAALLYAIPVERLIREEKATAAKARMAVATKLRVELETVRKNHAAHRTTARQMLDIEAWVLNEAAKTDAFVATVRAAAERGAEIPHHQKRVGTDGVEQPATKPVKLNKVRARKGNTRI